MNLQIALFARSLGMVGAILLASVLFIIGIIILIFPQTLVWFVGLGLILAAVAVFASLFSPAGAPSPEYRR